MTEEIWFSLRLSLQVALLATLFIVVVGIAVGYLLARKNFWGRELVDILFTLPLTIYTLAGSGDWLQAQGVVLLLTAASGVFLYLANRFSRRAW